MYVINKKNTSPLPFRLALDLQYLAASLKGKGEVFAHYTFLLRPYLSCSWRYLTDADARFCVHVKMAGMFAFVALSSSIIRFPA